MGVALSKDFMTKRKIDEATSNTSLSYLRYVPTEKSKWKVFKRKDSAPYTAYTPYKPLKGCPCGNNGPCKQKITPKGVTIHYPQKKKTFGKFGVGRRYTPPKVQKGYYNTNQRVLPKVKIVRPRKFLTWRLDKIICNSPFSVNSYCRSVVSRSRPYI